MPLPLLAIGLGAQALGGLFGLGQTLSANRQARNLQLPTERVNALLAQNQAQAQNNAKIGMAEQQYNNTLNQQNSNLATILAQQARSGKNTPVAGLLRQSNIATQDLNAQDANMRQANQRIAMQQNQVLAQEEQRVNKWNVQDPYLRAVQNIANKRNAGIQNMFGAIGGASQMLMAGAGAPKTVDIGNTLLPLGQSPQISAPYQSPFGSNFQPRY